MNVRANRSMKELLGADAESPQRVRSECPRALAAELRDGFKEVDGCVVPKLFDGGPIWSTIHPRVDGQHDETGFECGLSKIHVEDFAGSALPLADLACLGIAYALQLRAALLRSFNSGVFRIIIDAQLPDPDLEVHGSICTVRHHKIRPGQLWLTDDLDGYKLNGVMVIDFEAGEQ